jgi:hypothetical protein
MVASTLEAVYNFFNKHNTVTISEVDITGDVIYLQEFLHILQE